MGVHQAPLSQSVFVDAPEPLMGPQAITWKAGMLLAVLATITITGHSEVVPESEQDSVSQKAQAKLAVMDRQLWGTGPADDTDLLQVPAEQPKSDLRSIEENALEEAGFVTQSPEGDDTD